MGIFIVSNKPVAKAGRLVKRGKTKEELVSAIANTIFSKKGALSLLVPFFGMPISYTIIKELAESGLTISEEKSEKSTSSEALRKIAESANLIDKKTIIDVGVKFDNKIFNGAFKRKDHYDLIIDALPSDDEDIIICDMNSLSSAYNFSIEKSGVYFIDSHGVFPAHDYSDKKLEDLRKSIIDTFSSLGAKEISIKDSTATNSSASFRLNEKVTKLAPAVGLNLSRKTKFEIELSYSENRIIDSEKARIAAQGLAVSPELKSVADYLICSPGSLRQIKKNVSLDISFGVDVNLLAAFQGSYEGGHNRSFSLDVTF